MVGPHSSSCQQQAMLHSQSHGIFPAITGAQVYSMGQGRKTQRGEKATQPLKRELDLNPDLLFPICRPQLGLPRVEEISLGGWGHMGKWPSLP